MQSRTNFQYYTGIGDVIEVRPHKTLITLVIVKWPNLAQPIGHDPKTLVRV